MARLDNKIALVTGAARGIGAAIATCFIEQGAVVIVTDKNAEEAMQLCEKLGENAYFLSLDVSDEVQWQNVERFVQDQFGRLDILINNAGITGFLETQGPHDPEHLDLNSWHTVQQTNSDGVALGCKYGIRLMKASNAASIVNISSRSGLVGIPLPPPMQQVKPRCVIIANRLRCTALSKITRSAVIRSIRVPF